jgi:two-component system response regulator NreC
MTDDKITLFLTDDHQIVVEGIMALVAQDPCIHVVGHCNDGLEVLDKVRTARPDVLVLDISLPGLNGLDACRMVKADIPKTRILMLTMHTNEQCILDAFERGASGYLIKEAVAQEFCEAVHAVSRGEVYLGRGIPRSILDRINRKEPDPYDSLTDRERQVLQSVVEGKSNQQIGKLLHVSSDTIDADYASLTKKLKLDNQIELVKYAIRKHIIAIA